MPSSQVTSSLSVLFADISGSVAMYRELGDVTASRVVSEALWLMAEAATSNEGTVVETRGDEILCTFTEPASALSAGVAMQRAMIERLPSRNADTPAGFGLHVGIHHGEVIVEDQQLFGDTVNRAARVRSLAKRGQVLLSSSVRELLDGTYRNNLRFIDEVVLRGQNEPEPIYEYIWQTDATMIGMRPLGPAPRAGDGAQLRLRYGRGGAEVGRQRPMVVLGRGDSVDIVVVDHMASREHARIEQRRGRFFLHDNSTNGTYVELGGEVSFVHRDEIELSANGRICLGREFGEAMHIISFECSGADGDPD